MTRGAFSETSRSPGWRGWTSWLHDPRLVGHLPEVLGVVVFLGCFLRIRQRWFIEGMAGFGFTTWVAQTTIDGTAIAPDQYRPLMPWVDHLLALAGHVPLPSAILVSDLALLVVVLVLLHRLETRLQAPGALLAAAAGWAYWVRRWLTAVTGLGLVLAAAAATLVLADVLYPEARYDVAVVQLPFNLTPGVWAMVLTFYGALLITPGLLAVRTRSAPPMAVVIVWFLIQFAATFVVGRVEESRIFMPFAPVLGVAAVLAFRQLSDTRSRLVVTRRATSP